MNKVIVDAVFMRKHYSREIHELMFRDNVAHLDMGKKVNKPGPKIHGALPLVHILGGTDFSLAGEVNYRDVSVSCVVKSTAVAQAMPCAYCSMAKFPSTIPVWWNSVLLSDEGDAIYTHS